MDTYHAMRSAVIDTEMDTETRSTAHITNVHNVTMHIHAYCLEWCMYCVCI